MDRAEGYGLKSVRTQAKLTALAVNLKRIARLVSSNFNTFCSYMVKILTKTEKLRNLKIVIFNVA